VIWRLTDPRLSIKHHMNGPSYEACRSGAEKSIAKHKAPPHWIQTVCRIWRSQSGDYEEQYHLEYDSVQSTDISEERTASIFSLEE
jgi:hypothetical protein